MTTPPDASDERASAVRQRTRRAILEAAVSVWAHDFAASLGDIAQAAEVSRSTLHRYFPDRQALLDAALTDAVQRMDQAYERTIGACSSPAQELEGLLRVSVQLGDVVVFLFTDPSRFTSHPDWPGEESDPVMLDLLRRAQEDGAIADDLDTDWLISVYYSLVWAAAQAISSGTMPPHVAADVAVRTFFRGVGA